jgi:hypothetical protein
VAFKLYSVSFDDFAVKIRVAKGAADRLARDRADHKKRNERELVGFSQKNAKMTLVPFWKATAARPPNNP